MRKIGFALNEHQRFLIRNVSIIELGLFINQLLQTAGGMLLAALLNDPIRYGEANLLLQIFGMVSLFLNVGFNSALVYSFSTERAEVIRSKYRWALLGSAFFGVIVGLLLTLLAPWLVQAYRLPALEGALRAGSLLFLFNSVVNIGLAAFSGSRVFGTQAFFMVLGTLCSTAGTVLGVLRPIGSLGLLTGISLWMGAGALLTAVCICWRVERVHHPRWLGPVSLSGMRSMMAYGVPLWAGNIAKAFQQPFLVMVVGSASVVAVGQLANGFRITGFIGIVTWAFMIVAFPFVAESSQQPAEIRRRGTLCIRYNNLILYPLTLLICLYPNPINEALFGSGYTNGRIGNLHPAARPGRVFLLRVPARGQHPGGRGQNEGQFLFDDRLRSVRHSSRPSDGLRQPGAGGVDLYGRLGAVCDRHGLVYPPGGIAARLVESLWRAGAAESGHGRHSGAWAMGRFAAALADRIGRNRAGAAHVLLGRKARAARGRKGVLRMTPSTETKEQLEAELETVLAWEREQDDLWFFEKWGRLPFALLDKVTPKWVHDKLGVALDELGSYIQTGGRYLISERAIRERLEREAGAAQPSVARKDASAGAGDAGEERPAGEREPEPDIDRIPLAAMDKVAAELAESRSQWAALQGATTGFGGIFTLAVDIPALLGLSLKVLQEMAVCYGYHPQEKRERLFVVKCLQFASSDIVGKRAVLDELTRYAEETRGDRVVSQLQGWREVVTVYRDQFGWKKLFQLVPVAGMIFGALINRGTLRDTAEAGRMLYRKRRILERLAAWEAAGGGGNAAADRPDASAGAPPSG